MLNKAITFDDVLIKPKFSSIGSRKDVDLTTNLGDNSLSLPVLSANMSTITEGKMALAMGEAGGLGILHRFCSIEDNILMFAAASNSKTGVGVSVGLSDEEKLRAESLIDAGAEIICIDVAHGAQMAVVEQVRWLREKYKDNLYIIVGNFATPHSIQGFESHLGISKCPNIYKVGIGPGSACTTRLKTGCGVPQLSAILSTAKEYNIIADGGMKTPGDIAKALAAGAKAVMIGGMISGTNETPGEVIENPPPHKIIDGKMYAYTTNPNLPSKYKMYKGSAANGYGNGWKTSEGVEMVVECKGEVDRILKDIEGGLRSALTYTGSKNLEEFKDNAEFILVSNSTRTENTSHGEINGRH